MDNRIRRRLGIGLAVASPLVAAAVMRRMPAAAPKASLDAKRARAGREPGHVRAARRFNYGSALLAASVLADSAVEHYRGSYVNPAMYTPLVSSAFSLSAGLHGGTDRSKRSHRVRTGIYALATLTGLAGTAFHVYNVGKRVGGFSWNNLFYGAPLGAPAAMLLSGALGATAERLRDEPTARPRLFGMPAGQGLGVVATLGLLGSLAEVALLHFRGSFQHKAMYVPITVVPIGALLLGRASLGRPRRSWLVRAWLRLVALVGLVGMGFHARGVARMHGGWRNWSQNLLGGPPLLAPPSFTALAWAGLAALRLRQEETGA